MLSGREVTLLKALTIAVAGTVVIWLGAAAIILAVFGHNMQAAAPWLALAKFVSLAWAAAVGWRIIWPRLDEREREARKLSWLIGSTAAILLTAPIMLLWLENGGAFLAQLVHRNTPGVYFALGWIGLLFAQLLSSLIARAWWWAAKR